MPKGSESIDFYFNSDNNSKYWDLVVFWGIPKKDYKFKVRSKNTLFISGEPYLMQRYSRSFLNQFKYTATSYLIRKNNHIIAPPYIPWWYGFDFLNNKLNYNLEYLKKNQFPDKTKIMSVITSAKKFMPGHVLRLDFINELKNKFSDQIDFFGDDSIRLNDKADGINKYRFHLCFENISTDDYWSEKLADPILGFSIPVYYGCKNVEKYFKEGIIQLDLSNKEESLKKIEFILNNNEVIYENLKSHIINNRSKILNKLNLLTFVSDFYKNVIENEESATNTEIIIKSFKSFNSNILLNKLIRFKRLFYRIKILVFQKYNSITK